MRTSSRAAFSAQNIALAVIAFVPQLLTKPGVVVADTKAYLYIDVGRFLRQSASLWTTSDLGSVTYQQIGYLFPMGPFFWLVHVLHVPVWVGERIWVGALLFAAGSGVLYLGRTIGLDGPGRPVAALAFMLSPYFLQYLGRESELLLPWASLGWLLALTIRAVRTGGWRYPALFALVWLAVSGANATGALMSLIAPVLWLVYCVLVSHEHTWRQVWSALWRTAVLCAAVSLWWLASLVVEGRYGVNVLLYTETVADEALTSLSSEILRGLGYWYFYGTDVKGPWQPALTGFTQQPLLIALTFAVPLLALVATMIVRWRQRAYFVLIVLIAMIVAVGTHPYQHPSLIGALVKDVSLTTLGGALRSTDRATPTVILGLAMLLGAGVTAVSRRLRPAGLVAAVASMGLVAAANPAVWNGTTAPARYTFPSKLPRYVTEAADALDAQHTGTRVLAIPGQTFSAYRYGTTLDPVWEGLLSRPFVERQQLPEGSLASFDLLYGLDDPMQTGTLDTVAIAPLARLMSVGDVLVQNDLEYELYDQPNPRLFWATLTPTPPGLGAPTGYGKPKPNISSIPSVDPATLAASPKSPWPSPVEVLAVSDPRPIVRSESTSGDLVVDGDGAGLYSVAALGLLDTDAPVLYSASFGAHSSALSDAMSGGATLVVTDSNRRQDFNWASVQDNAGLMLTSSQSQPKDALDIFPSAPTNSQSVADLDGISDVKASFAGAEHSPAMAIDGDPDTAWETYSGEYSKGQWWKVELKHETSAREVTILQPTVTGYNYEQRITKATLSFDGAHPLSVTLTPASLSAPGQVVHFPLRRFRTLKISITATNMQGAPAKALSEASPVGLAEVQVGRARLTPILAMPTDLLAKVGRASRRHRLVLIMTRDRTTPNSPDSDPEPTLARQFTIPETRTFTLSGQARLSSAASDTTVDSDVGRGSASGIVAYSSSRLPGDVADTASAALDGDLSTMWSPAFGAASQKDSWIEVNLPRPDTFSNMDLEVVADGLHSVPTDVQIRACEQLAADGTCPSAGSQTDEVVLPAIANGREQDHTVSVPISFPTLTGRYLTFTFTGVRLQSAEDNGERVALPLGIAELGIPGVDEGAPPASIPAECRSNLLSIDGHPLWTEVSGSTSDALAADALELSPCGPDAHGITLAAGTHVVLSTPSQDSGFDVDQLVLDSAAGGGAGPAPNPRGLLAAPRAGPAPTIHVTSSSLTSFHLSITGAKGPFWLVLGESLNTGWKMTQDGSGHSVGSSLVDGFANGWLIQPRGSGDLSLTLRWTPQTAVTGGLVVSAVAAVACLVLALRPPRRRDRRSEAKVTGSADYPVTVSPFVPVGTTTMRRALPVAIACALVSAVVLPVPIIALAVGTGVFVALLLPEYRWILSLGAVLLCAAGVAYVVLDQISQRVGQNLWAVHFALANDAVWTALAFLAADVVVGLVLREGAGGLEGLGAATTGPGPLPPEQQGYRPPSPPT